MDNDQREFLQELLGDFRVEAAEHRQRIVDGLLALEQAPADAPAAAALESVLREAHSLKGAARAVDVRQVERLCQSLEGVLAALKRGDIALAPELLDVLHAAVDVLDACLAGVAAGQLELQPPGLAAVLTSLDALRKTSRSDPPTPPREPAEPPSAPAAEAAAAAQGAPPETVRISITKLGDLLREAEELIAVKSLLGHHLSEVRRIAAGQNEMRRTWEHLRRSTAAARTAEGGDPTWAAIEAWQAERFSGLIDDLARLDRRVDQDHRMVARMVDDLLIDMKRTLMFPFSSILAGFPKLVRDLARDRGKQVRLSIRGGAIEIDRRILEALKDPLVHVLRNAVDHGIETAEVRAALGKPPQGSVAVSITQMESGQVLVEVEDDGAGMDADELKASAIRAGVLPHAAAERMRAEEALHLAFGSGVSTSRFVTDISGRGLGLAIVAEQVAALGGTVGLRSAPGQGTAINLALPLTLATFRGVLVRVGEQLLCVPTTNVEQVTSVSAAAVQRVEGQPTALLGGHVTVLVALGDALGIPGRPALDQTKSPVLVLAGAGRRVGFLVDQVLGEQEGLIRGLGPQLVKVRNLAGATVLGSGRVVPVLDPAETLDAAVRFKGAPRDARPADEPDTPQTILVAEDSITSRSLLRNILESAGYTVATAVDGVDAARALREGGYDLLVSDVDMPRMNGFDLTALIRADRRLADLPVVLVTALDSPEDRERGLEAGANAYIVKSSFEQSNLLEAVRRLI